MSTPKSTSSKHVSEVQRRVNVLTVGDLFRERYYVPTVASGEVSPITYPEAMRGKSAVRVTTIPSGTELHAEVLRSVVNNMARDLRATKIPEERLPTVHTATPLDGKRWSYFNTYLHELGAFPMKQEAQPYREKVWRIKDTQGLVEEEYDNNDTLQTDDMRSSKAKYIIANQIREATKRVRKLDAKDALILVVNDRNQGFRECDQAIRELIIALETISTHKGADNILIIWHIRKPHDPTNRDPHKKTNYFAEVMARSQLRHRVIAVINQQCLRDQGVNLRFDISYEHTLKDMLTFCTHHRLLQDLLWFPQVLIRYDYGVMHVTTDEPQPETTDRSWHSLDIAPVITSLDVHGMIGGPFYTSPKTYGMTTGRTFLLVVSIVREIIRWFYSDPNIALIDAFRLEGITGRFDHKHNRIDAPMGICAIPSILRNTVIDKSIDLGILLNARHFYNGYGPFESGSRPPGVTKKHVTNHFSDLINDFDGRYVQHPPRPNVFSPFAFRFKRL